MLAVRIMKSTGLRLVARTGILSRIEVRMIGRLAVGWARGRFRYGHPSEMEQVPNEMLYGYVAHYTIGVGLAVPYLLGVGISWSEGLHHRYGRLPMASRRR